ncbi:MAG: hypothetical protein LBE31_11440, partial [Deltaproteobacteria bacterium]|nr:hypothetical protein [Deltaproteobacteria bacterium]
MPIRLLAIVIALVGVISSQALAGNRDPLPMPTRVEYPQGADNETVLKAFIGLPFRADGAVSDDGRWTLWADPTKTLSSPGFNCSGFVLTAVRHLTGQNIPLEEAAFDRDNDSGPDSALGRDWDYGLDLFLNLADLDNLMPTPQGPKSSVGPEGRPVGWGVDIHSHEFEEILSSLKTDQIYLVTISKPDRRFKVGLSYYHLALIHADIEGHLWIYQATARAGVHRLDLSTKEGLNAIRRYFPFIRGGGRRILLAPLRSQFLKPLPEAEKELEASLNEAPKDPPLEDLLKDLSGDILGQMLGEFLKDRTNGLSDNLTIVPDAQSSDQS